MNRKFLLNLLWHCCLLMLVGFVSVYILLELTGFKRPMGFYIGWSLSALLMAGFGTLPFFVCYRAATGKWFTEYFWLLWTLWSMIMFLALPGTYVTQKMQEVEDHPIIQKHSKDITEAKPSVSLEQDPISVKDGDVPDIEQMCQDFMSQSNGMNIEKAKDILELTDDVPMPCFFDADCVVVDRACGGHRVVAITYYECLRRAAMQYGSLLNCAQVSLEEPTAICHQGQCQIGESSIAE